MPSIVFAAIVNTTNPNTLTDLEGVFGNILGLFIPLGSIVLFVMLVLGGIKYISSGDKPGNVEQAKAIITYAIIGAVLLAMAYLILQVIGLVTGANLTTFELRTF